MLIRREQMQALGAPMRRRFEDRMMAHTRTRSARAADLSEDQLRTEVREIIDLAETHGIDREDDAQRFLELVFESWPDARNDAGIMPILNSHSLGGAAKVALVADTLSGREV